MKHQWNVALAAYDRELPLLRALRDEYLAYIRERLDGAKAGVGAELRDQVAIEVASAEEDDAGAELTLLGDGAESGLQCQLWASADSGDEPGKYVWALLMSRTLSPELGDPRRAVAVARQASAAVVTEPLDQAPATAGAFAGFDLIRWGQLDIDDPDFGGKLGRVFRSLVPAMIAARDAVLALRGGTPAGWASGILKQLRSDGTFEREGSTDTRTNQWKPGLNVSARVNASDYCWFTAATDGRIGFHWESKENPAGLREVLPTTLGASRVWKERWDGVVLVTADELARLHRDGDHAALRDQVVGAWRKYRDICLGSGV